MGITYNKEFKPKDRRVMPSGPRDRQIKQVSQISNSDQSLLIEELRSQINRLQEQIDNRKSIVVEGYTSEQVDEEIIKAVKSETENLKLQHEQEKNHLHSIINSKEEIIQQLKNNQNNNSGLTEERIIALLSEATKNLIVTSDLTIENPRPKMETVFVDPIEKNSNIDKHFIVEEIFVDNNVQLSDKENKLKGLLGKLPPRKN